MNDHIETPAADDVEGHVQFTDGAAPGSTPTRIRLSIFEGDDVEGHVLDLDVERKR